MMFNGKKRICGARFAFMLAAVAAIPTIHAQPVISEVLYDAAGTDNGNVFVELFGTPGTVLDGLLLEGINGTDGSSYMTVTLGGTIPGDGVFVIADDSGDGSSFVVNADLVADVDFQNAPDSIVLRGDSGILDALGYGDFSSAMFAGEGSPAADAPAGSSLARFNPLVDTDDNLADFLILDVPTPGTIPASAVPLPPAVMLFFSGIAGLAGIARRRS
ncbi:MAG: hypothetical protein PVJ66_02995 [Gammaproteobacteria bacterium]|jgi:hypothetical protein